LELLVWRDGKVISLNFYNLEVSDDQASSAWNRGLENLGKKIIAGREKSD